MSLALAENVEDIKDTQQGTDRRSSEGLSGENRQAARQASWHVHEEGKPDCGVKSNIKSIPGVMTIRGCAYAGSKGVVWGPIKDMIHISHGPVGCGQYSWAARRNYYIGTTGIDTFVHHAVHLRLPGEGHRLRRRQEARQDHGRDPGAVPAQQGHHGPVRMPDRPDRRRHRGGLEGQVARNTTARPSCRCAAKASAACRSRWATTSPTTRSATGCSTRSAGKPAAVRADALRRRHHRRLQHRRRRLVLAHPARGDGPARDRAVVGRRHHRRAGSDAEGQAQRAALLPLDELHLAAHGREVRYSVGANTTSSAPPRSPSRCARSPATSTTRSRKVPSASSPSTSR